MNLAGWVRGFRRAQVDGAGAKYYFCLLTEVVPWSLRLASR
jgi:hypothetical protein